MRRRAGRGAISWLVLGALAGCAEEYPDAAQVGRSDSAGVQFIRVAGPDTPLRLETALRIGVTDGDPSRQFFRIRSVLPAPANRVWVSDQNEALRLFDISGAYLASVGGRGGGPSEAPDGYGFLRGGRESFVTTTGPTILEFSWDGDLVTSRPAVVAAGGYLHPLSSPRQGRWMFWMQEFPDSTPGRFQVQWRVGLLSLADGDFVPSIELPGATYVQFQPGRISRASYFEGSPSLAADAESRIYYSHPLKYRIEVRDSSGAMIRVIARAVEETAYPDDPRDEIVRGLIDVLRGDEDRPVSQNELDRLTRHALPDREPDHLPYLQELWVSRDGFIWALRGDKHPNPALRAVAEVSGFPKLAWEPEWRAPLVFDLFDPDGAYRGTATLPERFVPTAVDSDRIFGSEWDEIGVEYVVAYRVLDGS